MRHGWIVVTALGLAIAGSPGSAGAGMLVVGGGEGRLGSDVDNDGDLDGSYFGIGVVQQGEETNGHFVYGMWGNTEVMELPLFALEGQIGGSEAVAGSADMLFTGTGTVDLGDGVVMRDLAFDVLVTPGGPDQGSMQLTLYGAFDGQLGDMVPGNGDCEMPPQAIGSGQISSRQLTEFNEVVPDGARMIGGGGLTSFGKDLDEDGDIDGAYFGLGIDLFDEGEDGHFVCAMWGDVEYWGLRLMAIEGRVDSVTFDDEDPNKFNFFGRGSVDLGMGPEGFFTDIAYDVQARAGGPTDGYLRLTIHGVLDGVPGDRIHENGDCDLPIEWVESGVIAMQLEAPSIPTAIESVVNDSPEDVGLVQNYPNPFNNSTVIRFSLTENTIAHLAIYNTSGQKVATLIDGPRQVGGYRLQWDGRDDGGRDLATGTYLVRLRAGSQIRESKLLLVR